MQFCLIGADKLMGCLDWKNEKTRMVAFWLVITPEIRESARQFATQNKDAPILYRAWIRSSNMQKAITSDGISVFDPELHFGQLSDQIALWKFSKRWGTHKRKRCRQLLPAH